MAVFNKLFTVKFSTPLGGPQAVYPLSLVDVTSWVTGLVYSSTMPGGFEACTIDLGSTRGGKRDTLRTPTDQRGTVTAPFMHVEVRAGRALVWEGRAMRFTRVAGEVRQIICAGYMAALGKGSLDASGSEMINVTPIGLLQLITQTLPLFANSQIDAPSNVTALVDTDINNTTPAQALDTLCKSGLSGIAAPLDWYCWEGRRLLITQRTAPQTPDYRIANDERVTLQEDYTGSYSSLTVSYQNNSTNPSVAATVGPVTNSDFVYDYGVEEPQILNIGTCSTTYANQYLAVALAQNGQPVYQTTITRTLPEGLELVPGGQRPPYLVRASEWLQLGTMTPALPIVRAEYDAGAQTGTYEVGSPAYDTQSLLARIRGQLQYFRARLHPNSGQPF